MNPAPNQAEPEPAMQEARLSPQPEQKLSKGGDASLAPNNQCGEITTTLAPVREIQEAESHKSKSQVVQSTGASNPEPDGPTPSGIGQPAPEHGKAGELWCMDMDYAPKDRELFLFGQYYRYFPHEPGRYVGRYALNGWCVGGLPFKPTKWAELPPPTDTEGEK